MDTGHGIRSIWVQVQPLILTNLPICVSIYSPSNKDNGDTHSNTAVRNKAVVGLYPLQSVTQTEGLLYCAPQISHKIPGLLPPPKSSKLGQSHRTFLKTILPSGLRGTVK